jgi:hypothetical protein
MNTPRLSLPLLAVAQAHKELTHNEALFLLDAAVQPVAESRTAIVPTNLGANDAGKCWLVQASASGDWEGKTDQLAAWNGDGWQFLKPFEGMVVRNKAIGVSEIYTDNQWFNSPSISDPTGGTVIDAEARLAITALFSHLRNIGLIAI